MGWQPVAPEFGIGGVIDEKIQIFGKAVPVISTAQGGAASQVKLMLDRGKAGERHVWQGIKGLPVPRHAPSRLFESMGP